MTFIAMLLLAGCVSQQKYDASQQSYALDTEYQQLNQTMSAEVAANQMQITRLQNAIKVTVNSELLFPSGAGKCRLKRSRPSAKSFRS
jgi:chemotaxis protein MotB